MIQLELKAKHFYLIAEILFGIVASDSFATLEAIRTACADKADEDLVTVNIPVEKIIFVYNILTYKPEGQFNRVNGEMSDLLFAQIQTELSKPEPAPEWVTLAQSLESTRTGNLAVVDNLVAAGKAKLYS